MRAALAALSYPDPAVAMTYKIERQLKSAIGRSLSLYRTWDHVIQSGTHEIPVRIFTPETRPPHDVLLFFHGGGWVVGNIDSYTKVCQNMARLTNRMVVSVDYRLAPEYRFPTAPEDCYAVARELYLNPQLLGATRERIAMIGDSAGGNLAAAVSLMARDRGEFLPFQQILIYPATHFDHSEHSPFRSVHENGSGYLLTSKRICEFMNFYLAGPDDIENPYFAPLCAKDLSNQPATLILTAEFDPLRDEGEAYAKALNQAGNFVKCHRMPDALHGFFSLPPHFALVKNSYSIINRFLRKKHPLPSKVDA